MIWTAGGPYSRPLQRLARLQPGRLGIRQPTLQRLLLASRVGHRTHQESPLRPAQLLALHQGGQLYFHPETLRDQFVGLAFFAMPRHLLQGLYAVEDRTQQLAALRAATSTELGTVAKLKGEFDKRNVRVIGLSVDSVDDHKKWSSDIEETQGAAPNYPMIGDPNLEVAKLYDMLPAETVGMASGRSAADNMTVRNVYVIGPDKKIKMILTYPMTTGRNFDEILRAIDSIQLTAEHKVSTPVNWKQGEDVIIIPAVSDDEARERFPEGWKALKPYLRIVRQPGPYNLAR